MSRPYFVLVIVSMLIPARTVSAGSWSFGSHFGICTLRGEKGGGASTVLAWPSNALAYQPALRIGFGDAHRRHELQLDTGMFLVDQGGSTLAEFSASIGYQFTYRADWRNAPFANLAGGFQREGGTAHSVVSTTWGAGLGMRHAVHDGHGALRVEGRFEYLQSADKIGRPAFTTLGLRMGFDLWM